MTLGEFQERLTASGLMTPIEAEQARIDFLASPAAGAEDATQAWGKFLLQEKRVTLFQVSALTSGKPVRLVLGEYELVEKLATGGMGDVYKAVHRPSATKAVVKVLPAASACDHELVQRFQREIRLLSHVKHPNVVAAYGAGDADGSQYLAMEFVDGLDLGRVVRHRGVMTPEDAVECIRQAAVGLAFAHERGVIHRDVKPSNLMLDQHGVVKILDLGLARILHDDDGLTSTGSVLGSVDYMAPEQGFDSKVADHRADVYALGCTLYYLTTGRIPFEAATVSQKLLAHQDAPPPSLRGACPAAPPKLEQLYLRMLAKEPKDRPTRMADLLATLKKVQRDLPAPDLGRYMRSPARPIRDTSIRAMSPTDHGPTPRSAQKVPTTRAPRAPTPMPSFASGRRTGAWRAWVGGAGTVVAVTALMAALLWNNG